jgi:hypothetical protein
MILDDVKAVRVFALSPSALPVEQTVAERLILAAARKARVEVLQEETGPAPGMFRIAVTDMLRGAPRRGPWMFFRINRDGSGEMLASEAHWLFPLCSMVLEEWGAREGTEFPEGILVVPTFSWLRNLSDFFVGSLRGAGHFERESYIRQLARQGFSHVTINGLGVERPFESGPPGDVYSWFYDYSPDLDQFVASDLLRGYYPADYLRANLDFLIENARLARKYGLTPGLHINSPRSMPEEFWNRYGFLRGARVDHPRETLRPRYTLAMAHPVVQRHYRELVRAIMHEVPEIGFMHVWTNDSGAGFEFVSSLYAGRNGGPYLIREWKNEEEIARTAAANVMTYYRLLRDEGRRVNPAFRLVCDLGPFYTERRHLLPELGEGIDVGEFAFFMDPDGATYSQQMLRPDVTVHAKVEAGTTNVIGMPFPRLLYERLQQIRISGGAVLSGANPESLAPFDINNEVVRSVQLFPARTIDEVLRENAVFLVGPAYAHELIQAWDFADAAVRAYPQDIPCSTFGFPWFRFWVRPFVPDIDAISDEERRYYEQFLLATFNNPARVDLNNDMMWNFLSVEEAGQRKQQVDEAVVPPLEEAVKLCVRTLGHASPASPEHAVFHDLHDRLVAMLCFYTTMRNSVAWTESVHGYMKSSTEEEKQTYRNLCRAMVDHELENARRLLRLWEESDVRFMPVSRSGESLHTYGRNFGDLLKKKIDLMERHRLDEPRIDPEYMWRMPNEGRGRRGKSEE